MSNSQKQLLEHSLSILLGLEVQDVSDVIDHLLTLDSEELKEYLSALLGDDTVGGETVQTFIENFGRFQRGESVKMDGMSDDGGGDSLGTANFKASTTTTSSSSYAAMTTSSSSTSLPKDANKKKAGTKPIRANASAKRAAKQGGKKGKQLASKKAPPSSSNAKAPSTSASASASTLSATTTEPAQDNTTSTTKTCTSQTMPSSTSTSTKDTSIQPTKLEPTKPSQPQWGKAKFNCGCYGTKYKALTNCLNCGRIICEREGYGYCPFCGHLVEDILTTTKHLSSSMTHANASNLNKAILHKERLLQFDRENAQRTRVLDDQVDYYRNSTSTWLNEEEQAQAEEMEEQRRKDMHERKKPVLNIQF